MKIVKTSIIGLLVLVFFAFGCFAYSTTKMEECVSDATDVCYEKTNTGQTIVKNLPVGSLYKIYLKKWINGSLIDIGDYIIDMTDSKECRPRMESSLDTELACCDDLEAKSNLIDINGIVSIFYTCCEKEECAESGRCIIDGGRIPDDNKKCVNGTWMEIVPAGLPKCQDTLDEGKNYNVKGFLDWPLYDFSSEEKCRDSTQLLEYWCEGDTMKEETVNCEFGCTDGACQLPACPNNICNVAGGECTTCPSDCSATPSCCGNGLCDKAIGENYSSCSADCPCRDSDNDGFDNCSIGQESDDGKKIDCNDSKKDVNPDVLETCDGIDNNCDSFIDNGMTAPNNDNQYGVCLNSKKTCFGATGWQNDYSTVLYNEYPIEISCDAKDNDCDNVIDEGCSCVDGSTQLCGDDTGECAKGTQICSGGVWGSCAGETLPVAEICDVKDNDCDGVIDNGVVCSDVIKPIVSVFNAVLSASNANLDWVVSDAGGSHLDRIEIWRAPDSGGAPGIWNEVLTLRKTLTSLNIDSNTDSVTDAPGNGVWWYGIHVVDQSGNIGTEPSPIKISVVTSCVENWTCTVWSACVSGSQNRTCIDNNNCGTTNTKPSEIQACFSVAIGNPSDGFKVALDGFPVSFNAFSLGGQTPYVYSWKKDGVVFGDNTEFQNLLPIILGLGNHTISVTATDSKGASSNDSINIEVLPIGSLIVDINAWQTEFVRDMGLNLMLHVNGGTFPYTYTWSSNIEGNFSNEQFPNVDLSDWALGDHKINAVVKDSFGITGSDVIDIKILDMLVSIMDPKDGQTFSFGENINFSVWAQGGTFPYIYKWVSNLDGDITAGTGEWFTRDNLSEGYHTITVSATDSSAVPKTVSKSFNISINPAPTLGNTINSPLNNSAFFQGDNISFQASISGGVWPYTYKWSSNLDGQISISDIFEKNNLSVGSHVITFTSSDNSGQAVSNSISLKINPPLDMNVIIKSPNNDATFYAGDSIVYFNSEVSGGVSPYIYQWSSSINGVISDKASFYTTNLSQGNHAITLKITDQNNKVSSKTINLNINPEPNFNNIKNTSKYSAKETFLISNKNWRDVLSLIPITVWGNNKYPLLTYHEESMNIDIDSAIHFIQSYEPDHLTTVGALHFKVGPLLTSTLPVGANLEVGEISNINSSDYFSYWNTINSLVIVDYNNYQAGLIAATLASYKNAPIIFVDSTNLDIYKNLIKGKVIYSVGDLNINVRDYINNNASVAISFDIQALQRWYINKTNTDKIILIDSGDFNNYYVPTLGSMSFFTEKGGSVAELFNKLSLAAPYLAAGKKELILFNDKQDLAKISDYFNVEPKYKTVMISHDLYPDPFSIQYSRIVGITNTDTFSYVSRSLFYNKIFNQIYGDNFSKYSISADLSCYPGSAWTVENYYALHDRMFDLIDYHYDDLKNKQFAYYTSHGSQFGWSCGVFDGSGLTYNNIPFLDLSFGSAGSCLTGGYDGRVGIGAFAYNWLRMGGMAYWGANREIGVSEIYYAYKPYDYWESGLDPDLYYIIKNVGGPFVMYGDPTLKPIYSGPRNDYLQPTLTVGDGVISGQRRIERSGGQLTANFSCNVYDKDKDKAEQKIDFEGDGIFDQDIFDNVLVYHTYTTGVYRPYCRAVDTSGAIVDTFVDVIVNP